MPGHRYEVRGPGQSLIGGRPGEGSKERGTAVPLSLVGESGGPGGERVETLSPWGLFWGPGGRLFHPEKMAPRVLYIADVNCRGTFFGLQRMSPKVFRPSEAEDVGAFVLKESSYMTFPTLCREILAILDVKNGPPGAVPTAVVGYPYSSMGVLNSEKVRPGLRSPVQFTAHWLPKRRSWRPWKSSTSLVSVPRIRSSSFAGSPSAVVIQRRY